ncbi:MAG: hypothetical protein R8G66_30030 [Cytophagales bacterium]|nr:hypothetical protein [Cytophagales bacterium]
MKQISFLMMALLMGFWACKPSQPTQVTNYSEDLSIHRPDFSPAEDTPVEQEVELQDPVELTGHLRAELDSVLSIIVAGNLKKTYWDGYTIQVYNGLNREQAYGVRKAVENMELGLPVRLEYRQPNYKVKVGLYFNQLTAHSDLMNLKKEFSASLLIPEKIKLADYELSD